MSVNPLMVQRVWSWPIAAVLFALMMLAETWPLWVILLIVVAVIWK
jgi:hypothetical protein